MSRSSSEADDSVTETIRTIAEIAQPYHVTITKNAKGQFQFEVSIYGDDKTNPTGQALEEVKFIELRLAEILSKAKGGSSETEEGQH